MYFLSVLGFKIRQTCLSSYQNNNDGMAPYDSPSLLHLAPEALKCPLILSPPAIASTQLCPKKY